MGNAGSATSSTRDYVLRRSAHRLRPVQLSNAATLCHYARIVTNGNRPGIMSILKRPIRINDSARCLSSLQDKTHFFLSCRCNRSALPRETGHACGHKATMHPKGNENTKGNRAFIHNSSSMSFRTASDRGRRRTAKRVDVLCVIN
jgi:hypothetical protein